MEAKEEMVTGSSTGSGSHEEVNLDAPLPTHPDLIRGKLANGLEYNVIPNKNPPGKIYAYMQVGVGSIDEDEDECGMAHFLEHLLFLGTEKYRKTETLRSLFALNGMAFGSDVNAYTDFRETVYTLETPNKRSREEKRLRSMSDAERAAEARAQRSKRSRLITQQTIVPEVPQAEEIEKLDEKYLRDDPMMLLLDVMYEMAFKALISEASVDSERGAILSEMEMRANLAYWTECKRCEYLHPNKLPQRFPIGKRDQIERWKAAHLRAFYEKWYRANNIRLWVVGDFDCSAQETVEIVSAIFGRAPGAPAVVKEPIIPEMERVGLDRLKIATNELYTSFSAGFFQLMPLAPVTTYRDIRRSMIHSMLAQTFDSRIEVIYQNQVDPPFQNIALDYSDSFRENCGVASVVVESLPDRWKEALFVAVQEIHRLFLYGLTEEEFEQAVTSFLKECAVEAEQKDTCRSDAIIDEYMDCTNIGEAIMDTEQDYEAFAAVAETITIEDMLAEAKILLQFMVEPSKAKYIPATFITTPTSHNGESFSISPEQFLSALEDALAVPEPPAEVDVPDELISEEDVQELCRKISPSMTAVPSCDKPLQSGSTASRVQCRVLSNGVRLQYLVTDFEAKQCSVRLFARGGRLSEKEGELGALELGMATWYGSGAGKYLAEEIDKYTIRHAIELDTMCKQETSSIISGFSVTDGGLRRCFQLIHIMLEASRWEENAFERARRERVSEKKRLQKDVGFAVNDRIASSITVAGESRLRETTIDELESLSVEVCRRAFESVFCANNLEVVVVGDFDPDELEKCILEYMGTLSRSASDKDLAALRQRCGHIAMRHHSVQEEITMKGTQQKAFAVISWPSLNRWGVPCSESTERESVGQKRPRANDFDPVRFWKIHVLLSTLVNSRLYKVIREERGLLYAINYSTSGFSYCPGGNGAIFMSPRLGKVKETLEAVHAELKKMKEEGFTEQEFKEEVWPLMAELRNQAKTNMFWSGMIAHLQDSDVPYGLADIEDLAGSFENVTLDDIRSIVNLGSVISFPSALTCVGYADPDFDGTPEWTALRQ